MNQDVFVAGVGMIPFTKPGASEAYPQMAAQATRQALADAGIGYEQVQQAYAGYVYGDSTAGQAALYEVGLSGIPIVNVNNNCSTGSTALFLARQAVASGAADCVLALGFEQMRPGALGAVFNDRPSPFERFDKACAELVGHDEIPLALRYFGGAGLAHMQQYGTQLSTFAKVRAKASRHASNNPLALLRRVVTEEEVMNRPGDVARRDDPPDGLPADLRRRRGGHLLARLRRAARPRAQRAHQGPGDDHRPPGHLRGARHEQAGRLRHGAGGGRQVYEPPGFGPEDVDVVELHDCFAAERTDHLRGARPVPRGRRRAVHRATATTPTAARWSPTRPAACSRRAIRWAPPGWPSATSWSHQLRGTAEQRQVEGARLGAAAQPRPRRRLRGHHVRAR